MRPSVPTRGSPGGCFRTAPGHREHPVHRRTQPPDGQYLAERHPERLERLPPRGRRPPGDLAGPGASWSEPRSRATPRSGSASRRSTSRSPVGPNAGNWYTSDQDHGMAAHEFGHLIGLRDEYNQGPEALHRHDRGTAVRRPAGRAPTGDDGNPVSPDTVATEMRTAVTSSPANRRGGKAKAVVDRVLAGAGCVRPAHRRRLRDRQRGGSPAGGHQPDGRVPHGGGCIGHHGNDIAARIPRPASPGSPPPRPRSCYSNRSLMGTMESLSTRRSDPHDHPVAERHVRHFAEIVGRNRPGSWRVTR